MIQEIGNEDLRVKISSKGAELQSIIGPDGCEYLWQGDPDYWDMRAPNPFPYIASHNMQYRLRGQVYSFAPMGLVVGRELEVTEVSETAVTFELRSTEALKESYPYDFVYRLTYSVEGYRLRIALDVRNLDTKMMYFAFGGHPGFNVPLEEGMAFEDYYLEFSEPCHPYEICLKNRLCAGMTAPYKLEDDIRIPLRHELFAHSALILGDTAKSVTLRNSHGKRGLTVDFPDMRYVGLFHTFGSDSAPFVCIEPWASMYGRDGVVEDMESQPDMIQLSPGNSYKNEWSVTVF